MSQDLVPGPDAGIAAASDGPLKPGLAVVDANGKLVTTEPPPPADVGEAIASEAQRLEFKHEDGTSATPDEQAQARSIVSMLLGGARGAGPAPAPTGEPTQAPVTLNELAGIIGQDLGALGVVLVVIDDQGIGVGAAGAHGPGLQAATTIANGMRLFIDRLTRGPIAKPCSGCGGRRQVNGVTCGRCLGSGAEP